jgi:hypothetical protein
MHDVTRRDIVRQAWTRAADQVYSTLFGLFPAFAAHNADVAIDSRGRFGAFGLTLLVVRWR